MEGDKLGGCETLPILYGVKKAAWMISPSFILPFLLINLGTYAGIQLLRPFIAMDKGQIAAEGARLGVDFSRTYSCYKGGAIHCGTCGTCVERREAFLQAGLADPTEYASRAPLPKGPNA